jgi:hypothetical protein
MARLDEAEQSARSGAEDEGLDPAEAVDFLRNLPALWEEAPNSRRALAESLFESVDVLGLDTMHVEPTPAASAGASRRHFVLMSLLWSGREDLNRRFPCAGLWCRRGFRRQSPERPEPRRLSHAA